MNFVELDFSKQKEYVQSFQKGKMPEDITLKDWAEIKPVCKKIADKHAKEPALGKYNCYNLHDCKIFLDAMKEQNQKMEEQEWKKNIKKCNQIIEKIEKIKTKGVKI